MKVALIVAMDQERGIGRNNDLMWHLPTDMRFFKETTLGHIVIMGRKNYDSIPEKYRPLPQRENVVLTRNQDFEAQNVKVFHSFDECLNYYDSENNRNIFIIGGGEIYKQALVSNIVQEMYITHVDSVFGADTFFPSFDINSWDEEILFSHPKDDKNEASFTVKKYVKKALTF